MRWHYRDPLLVWLFIPAYALHVLEEWIGGFPEWVAFFAGAPLPRSAFALINAAAMFLMIDLRFIEEGAQPDGLYLILSGEVVVGHHTPDGPFAAVAQKGPGEFFGELAVARRGARRRHRSRSPR